MVDYYTNKIFSKRNFKNTVKKKKHQILHFNLKLQNLLIIKNMKLFNILFHYP